MSQRIANRLRSRQFQQTIANIIRGGLKQLTMIMMKVYVNIHTIQEEDGKKLAKLIFDRVQKPDCKAKVHTGQLIYTKSTYMYMLNDIYC